MDERSAEERFLALQPKRLKVVELTGESFLSRRELKEAQIVVATPEKWDIVTRRGGQRAGHDRYDRPGGAEGCEGRHGEHVLRHQGHEGIGLTADGGRRRG